MAVWYDELLEAGSGPHETALAALSALLPEQLGERVLDVGCGQGLATRALLTHGARSVVGVDACEQMLEIARQRTPSEQPISYRLDHAEQLSSCRDASFDGVACQLSLMDLADLDAALRSIRRVLKPGGWLVFIIGHPCFLAPHAETRTDQTGRQGRLVSHYFDAQFWRSGNPAGVRGRAGNYHRALSSYLNALINADLQLEETLEPPPAQLLIEQQPVYQHVPIFFAARARAA
jgi:ubiquinone/menaquinone biosynthesis C-methylase UbiE